MVVSQLFRTFLFWVLNPYNMVLLLASVLILQVLRKQAGDVRLHTPVARIQEILPWYALSLIAVHHSYSNRGSAYLPVCLTLDLLVLLYGVTLLWQIELKPRWSYSTVGIYGTATYGIAALVAAGLTSWL